MNRAQESSLVSLFAILFFALTGLLFATTPMASAAPFINEIHYDNSGADIEEGIEIAGENGTDLTGWSIVFYNGGNGEGYKTTALSGAIPDQQNGFGTLSFTCSGIQNGAPDGLALIDAGNAVIQFLSYEGTFSGTDGAADGMTSTDIGVSEPSETIGGYSLQLIGKGSTYADFTWIAPEPASFGEINGGQVFDAGPPPNPIPLPSTILLLGSGLLGLIRFRGNLGTE